MKHFGLLSLITLLMLSFTSCAKDNAPFVPEVPQKPLSPYDYEEGEELPIGKFSTSFYNYQAFGIVLPGLTTEQRVDFGLGDRIFMQTFSEQSGLGPRFNARACSNCHFRDGRGRPLAESTDVDAAFSRGFLIRLSVEGTAPDGGPKPAPIYGGQLQDRGLDALGGEAKVRVQWVKKQGTYPDGSTYELQVPNYSFYEEKFGSLEGMMFSPRVGGQTIGLGFVDALTEEQILANADENDIDGDGISGKANYVWNVKAQKKTIGKFGWKANAPTLEQQIAGALSGDMGITTSLFPDQNCPPEQTDCQAVVDANDSAGKIELKDEKLAQLTAYQATLAVPARLHARSKKVLKGKGLFHELNCIKCHRVGFKVEKSDLVPQIDGTVFNPYSDFLLHDMGEDLADNRPDYLADGREWRTQPLWGIGMIKTVNGHTSLLHDGRARNIEEAILWHGGEAEASKKKFMELSRQDRQAVLSFVNSL